MLLNSSKLFTQVELVKDNEVKDPVYTGSSLEYKAILTKFEEYFETKTFSDFTFVCSDGVEVPAHRMILAMSSDVMKAKLKIDLDEVRTVKANIRDIDGATMTEVLRFLYTNKIKNIKGRESKLLFSAEKYELNDLKKHCVDLMAKNLCIENAFEYLMLSEQYGLKYLERCSAIFIKL
jgi:hypothetical protein